MERVTARAHANVALAKYWGKRDERLNLPSVGSISVALEGLHSVVTLTPAPRRSTDSVRVNNESVPPVVTDGLKKLLDLVRAQARSAESAELEVVTNFPVAAGLASSASIFAALALAASRAYGLSLGEEELTILARRGSGSASRSIHGGFVEWKRGEAPDGRDSVALRLAPPSHWALGILVAVTDEDRKKIGSRDGMAIVAKYSPYFGAWLATHDADLNDIRRAIANRDLALLGETAEHNCLKMHAASIAARPALLYWSPATLAVIHRVRELRSHGLECYFTVDAGPQVKILCRADERGRVAQEISAVPGVRRTLFSAPGPAAEILITP